MNGSLPHKTENDSFQLISDTDKIITGTDIKPIMNRVQCPRCDKTYAGKNGLKQHMDKHHAEPGSQPKNQCGYCNKIHACSSNLKRHMLSCKKSPYYIKPHEGKFVCGDCADNKIHCAFKQKCNLVSHCRNNHNSYDQ